VLRLFVQEKKRPLAGVLGPALTSIWKGVLMSTQYARQLSRRRFLAGLTLVGAAG